MRILKIVEDWYKGILVCFVDDLVIAEYPCLH